MIKKILKTYFLSFLSTKNKAIINAYYQTENGAIISSPSFKDKTSNIPHGSVGKPVTKYLKVNKLSKTKKTGGIGMELIWWCGDGAVAKTWQGLLPKVPKNTFLKLTRITSL